MVLKNKNPQQPSVNIKIVLITAKLLCMSVESKIKYFFLFADFEQVKKMLVIL